MAQVSGQGAPAQAAPSPQPAQPQQQVVVPPPDPLMQAAIEQDFKPVNLKLGPPKESQALCAEHGLEQCTECKLDFTALNALAKLFVANPNLACPPPPQVVQQQRSQAVNKTKEDGNALFKAQKHAQAVSMYTMALSVASQRLPWEPSQLMREEMSTVLSNRSAAHTAAGDYISALVDADVVIQLKKPWSKGHFRKAKALLELGRLQDAKEAIQLGLSFEPKNTEMNVFLDEINTKISKQESKA